MFKTTRNMLWSTMKALSAIGSPAQDELIEKVLPVARIPCYE